MAAKKSAKKSSKPTATKPAARRPAPRQAAAATPPAANVAEKKDVVYTDLRRFMASALLQRLR
jgi:hypothetical protein